MTTDEDLRDLAMQELRKARAGERAALEAVAKTAIMLGETYRERAHLVALLAAEYPSVWVTDESAGPGWRVVYLDLPTGQASWHISPNDWDLFGHIPQGDAGIWDGHTTEQKYRRVHDLALDIHLRRMTAAPDEESVAPPCAVCRCRGCEFCELYRPIAGSDCQCTNREAS